MEDKKQDEQNLDTEDLKKDKEEKKEGSGIFTVDGEELPKIDGGYTSYNPGGTLGENSIGR